MIKSKEILKTFMEELVSIIIPAYQEEKKIGRCLRSICQSSYRNLEIIVVNDGSTDKTKAAVQNFVKKHKEQRIKLISISNGGSAHARNIGLAKSKGRFIGFVDADDLIHPQMIRRLVSGMRRGNDLSVCGQVICNEKGIPAKFQYPLKKQYCRCPKQALKIAMWEQILMSSCSSLFRREKIFDEKGNFKVSFPENSINFEDFAFVCKYIYQCDGILEVQPYRGYYYCRRAGSQSSKIYMADELKKALQPVMNIGEKINDNAFTAHKLQYAFRFMAYWYEAAAEFKKNEILSDKNNLKVCKKELEKYADIYMHSEDVSFYKKTAMWIARNHPYIGLFLAKSAGRLILKSR